MDDTTPPRSQVPAAWTEAIEAGLADVAAGRTFDFDLVMAEFAREDEAELAAQTANTKSTRSPARA